MDAKMKINMRNIIFGIIIIICIFALNFGVYWQFFRETVNTPTNPNIHSVNEKQEQLAINEKVLEMVYRTENEVKIVTDTKWHRLRSCQAYVTNIGNISVLRSYDTIIAVIDHTTDTLYDFLRYVYGYTSTSAQHITKFNYDYCNGNWGCVNRLTYREV